MALTEQRIEELKEHPCVKKFAEAIQERILTRELELSRSTIRVYLWEIDYFYRVNNIPFDKFPTKEHCMDWREKAVERFTKKTVARKISTINLYLEIVCGFPWKLPQVKNIVRENIPAILTEDEVMDMIHFAENNEMWTKAALIFIAFKSAGRRTAVQNLTLDCIKDDEIVFKHAKGDKHITVPMNKDDIAYIWNYIEHHRYKPIPGHERYVFISKKTGKRVHDLFLHNALKYCAAHCSIKVNVHAHTLRHSRVKSLRQKGYSWEEIMEITGHEPPSLKDYIHAEKKEIVKAKLNGNRSYKLKETNELPYDRDTEHEYNEISEMEKLRLENENLRLQLQILQMKGQGNTTSPQEGAWEKQRGYQ